MKTYEVRVAQYVQVTLDETKFTPEWMQEFRDSFYKFDTLSDHAEHIAQVIARGLTSGPNDAYVEGYGRLDEMGIDFDIVDTEVEMVHVGQPA